LGRSRATERAAAHTLPAFDSRSALCGRSSLNSFCHAAILPPRVPQVLEPTHIQAFVAQLAVETFHVPIEARKLLRENANLYFPDRAFTTPGGSADKQLGNRIAWLASYLRSVGEPSLPNQLTSNVNTPESYRLVLIGFSAGKIIVLRLSISANGAAQVFAKQTAYNQTSLLLNEDGTVPKEAVNGFLELVTKAKFWELLTIGINESRMPDGSYWYFEGAKPDQCHIVIAELPNYIPIRSPILVGL
jgi:hypothetical protein